MSFFDDNAQALADFERMSATAGARCDYVQGGGGNTSVKLDGLMAIKASGYRLSQVVARDGYAVLDLSVLNRFFGDNDPATLGDVEAAGTAAVKSAVREIAGLKVLRPSVESGFHSLLDRFVLHTHCVWANLAMCAPDGSEQVAQALADSGLSWCEVGYVNPGAALTFEIRAALSDYERIHGARPGLVFMRNHGLIATAADADAATALHEQASDLMARHYGRAMADYPARPLVQRAENEFASGCDYLKSRIASGNYGARELLDDALYPDQMVFFRGSLKFCQPGDAPDMACNIYPDGAIEYRCARATAEAIEQTLTAVVLIHETLRARGQRAVPMSQASQSFIAGWEAEAARRKLMSN